MAWQGPMGLPIPEAQNEADDGGKINGAERNGEMCHTLVLLPVGTPHDLSPWIDNGFTGVRGTERSREKGRETEQRNGKTCRTLVLQRVRTPQDLVHCAKAKFYQFNRSDNMNERCYQPLLGTNTVSADFEEKCGHGRPQLYSTADEHRVANTLQQRNRRAKLREYEINMDYIG
ncbi:uncharacterized protein EI90DRAFT_3022183 [Cantharellus anzutake]|uniref:uncharacterized protein n=1 Tax=Cantharellus anzutake TaxID=1750568 RepID=UPI001907AA5F|nr:uncharacterized protein EI90DRAFT_3022183 [Cantharellus anzutake]KAF8314827.1 hypothetical protein EI90DRAFT_3022183 [Cantharellus anzutake]